MSAAANAAAFLWLRSRLQPNAAHAEHPVAVPRRSPPAPERRPVAEASPARSVRVTYRRGRLSLAQTRTNP